MQKLRGLQEAIATEVQDGMSIFMGAALESLIPFAAGHEIIRQKKRNLTLMTTISDMQFDQLIGAGVVGKVCGAWVGNVAAGLGHNYRRAVESQIPIPLEVENHSNFTVALGLKAAAMGLPFLPTHTLIGSDLQDESQFSRVVCPFTKRHLLAVRELRPDVAILHVQRADSEGNAHVWGNLGVTQDAAMAAGKVVLTCEEIVSHEVILSDPNRTLIPGFLVAAIAHVPFGSHPSPTQGYSRRDDSCYFDYHRQSRDRDGFLQWLDAWVLGVDGPEGYMEKLGPNKVAELRPSSSHMAAPVSYSY
ncbi:MAG: CoA transferase subunit A [Planctomycetota bacterium]|jgi:glutaconate CoA-transferase subunit A